MRVVASLAPLEMLVKRSLAAWGLVEHVRETLLSDLEDVGDVGHTREILHVVQTVGLRVCVCKFSVKLGLAERLAGHLEVPDKIVVLAGVVCDLDNFGKF